jgi:hypothetical protein
MADELKPSVAPGTIDPMVEITGKVRPTGRSNWLAVEVENLDGKGIHLLVMKQAVVLQVKRAVAREEGTPAFQQHLWAEGAELQNDQTVGGVLREGSKISLVKGEAGRQKMPFWLR